VVEQQEGGEVSQLVLPVPREHLQVLGPCWTEPESSPGSCNNRRSQDTGQCVDEAHIGEADFQEELDIFLKVRLGFDEA